MNDGNYIKINRSILGWEWYQNINTKVLFLHMLLKANWKDGKFEGKVIERGSFVSSIETLSKETNLTIREIRTAITHLKMTGEVTSKSTNKYTVYTVVNYDLYQSNDKQNDKQSTSKRQANDILTTTIEEYKEYKERKNINKNNICASDNAPSEKKHSQKKVHEEHFEKMWKLYPVKKGKANISDAQKAKLTKISIEEMTRAIERYKEYVESLDYLHYKNGSTWFNSGYIDYLDCNAEPEEKHEPLCENEEEVRASIIEMIEKQKRGEDYGFD